MEKRKTNPGNEDICKTCENLDNNKNGFYCMVIKPYPQIWGNVCTAFVNKDE